MDNKEKIKRELSRLIEKGTELLGFRFRDEEADQTQFGFDYQHWYTQALPVVQLLAPDRFEEFVSYYSPDPRRKKIDAVTYVLQDFVQGLAPAKDASGTEPYDFRATAQAKFITQCNVLTSLYSRLDSALTDVEATLLAEIEDAELDVAGKLLKTSKRAAGAVAGVVLERHLGKVASMHKVTIRKKAPTVGDYNEVLKKKGVYDLPVYRKIQYLADVRNICCHNKNKEPTKDQVVELIQGVQAITKTVY